MKARVKETGEIVEVEFVERKTHTGEQVYMTHEGCLIEESRLDFNVEPIDYWDRLLHQFAGMAMQGILACEEWKISPRKGVSFAGEVALQAQEIAHALVEMMKGSV
jgi:hypothetical protein